MSLKQEIETWVQALAHYDNNEFEEALKTFDAIADTSRILFNCGVIHATLGEHQKAIECYQRAVRQDQYLAVAYFQQGVSNFLIGDFEEALANFNDTLLYLRGNTVIDYDQLGLKFKLYSCEVLFNRGLCYIYMQQKEEGLQDFTFAVKEKAVEDHNVIDEAIQDEAEGYTVFSIPVGVVYRPNSAKVKNLKTKDYLGKARLVAATARNDAFTGFTGAEVKRNEPPPATVRDDRPPDSISFAASHLVKPNLRSRTRQQSEPPLNRQVFPPTPPPESDKLSPIRRSNELERPFSFNRSMMASSMDHDRGGNAESDRSMSVAESGPSEGRDSDKASQSSRGANPLPPLFRTNTESSHGSSVNMTERAASVRSGKGRPPRLDGLRAAPPSEGVRERPRLGTIRTASEPRGPSRSYSNASGATADQDFFRPRLPQWDRSQRRPSDAPPQEEAEDGYPAELYEAYRKNKSYSKRTPSRSRARPEYIEEEQEGDDARGSDGEGDVFADDNDFDMVSPGSVPPGAAAARRVNQRSTSRKREIRKIRIKVHVAEDTRYILLGSNGIDYDDFTERVRDKFQLKGRFKCTVRDDGDIITMGDQDDLDMAISTCKAEARREGVDMGKMEVWVVENR